MKGAMEAMSSQSGMILPLNLTQASAQSWPSKYGPNIFLHWAQFLKQTAEKKFFWVSDVLLGSHTPIYYKTDDFSNFIRKEINLHTTKTSV